MSPFCMKKIKAGWISWNKKTTWKTTPSHPDFIHLHRRDIFRRFCSVFSHKITTYIPLVLQWHHLRPPACLIWKNSDPTLLLIDFPSFRSCELHLSVKATQNTDVLWMKDWEWGSSQNRSGIALTLERNTSETTTKQGSRFICSCESRRPSFGWSFWTPILPHPFPLPLHLSLLSKD